MPENRRIRDLLEQSEDQLFQRIVDEQEGLIGLEESRQSGGPSKEALARWTAELDKLEARPAPRRRWKRVALAAAIVAAVLALSALAYQMDFLNFVETIQEQFTQLSPSEPPEKTASTWIGAYRLEYVPEGYLMSDAVDNGDTKAMEYANSEGIRFTFYQSGCDTVSRADTEAADAETRTIGGGTGYLVKKDGQSQLLWQTTDAAFCIVYGETPEEEIMKIAESLSKIEGGNTTL